MLSKRLESLRIEKDLTHQDIADILKITRQAYGNYENGKRQPDYETLERIANFFDVSVDYLLGRTDIRKSHIPQEYLDKHKITKRDISQYENFVENAGAFFMDDEVSEEDKEALFKDISDLFWKAKDINKEKYGKKKKD